MGTSCRFLGGVRGNGVGIGMEDPVAAPLSKQDHQYEKVQALVTVYTIKQKPTKQQTKVLAHFELSVYFPEHLKKLLHNCNCKFNGLQTEVEFVKFFTRGPFPNFLISPEKNS